MANFWLELKKEREAKIKLVEMLRLSYDKNKKKQKKLWLPSGN
jgi:hypothetical protein